MTRNAVHILSLNLQLYPLDFLKLSQGIYQGAHQHFLTCGAAIKALGQMLVEVHHSQVTLDSYPQKLGLSWENSGQQLVLRTRQQCLYCCPVLIITSYLDRLGYSLEASSVYIRIINYQLGKLLLSSWTG